MSNEQNATSNEAATAEGRKGPKKTKLLTELIGDAREDLAKAQAKLDELLSREANAAKYDAIAKGDTVAFDFGRGEKVREITGIVTHREGDKLAVLAGEGLEQKPYIIGVQQVKVSP